MTKNEQLRIAAIEKLRTDGVTIHADSKTASIVTAIEKLTGSRCHYAMSQPDFVRAYVYPVVPARQMGAFKPLTLDPILAMNFSRASQCQKVMMTPNGVGNGDERIHGYGRGR